MNKKLYTDEDVVNAIRAGGSDRDGALRYIFDQKKYWQCVKEVIMSAGGENTDTDMIFEDCLIAFDRIVRRYSRMEDSIQEFFSKVARKIWCAALKNSEPKRQKVLNNIGIDSKLKKQIQAAVMKNSGNSEDALDCYQNGILLLESQLREGKYRGGAIKGYFYQLCFNLWRNELKHSKTYSLESESYNDPQTYDDPLTLLESKQSSELLSRLYDLLGESCRKILNLKYFIGNQLSMDEIAEKMGLKSAQNASNALSKCRKKLWELMVKHKMEYAWKIST